MRSPFEAIDGLDDRESRRLQNECKMKFTGDDSMITEKQYNNLFDSEVDKCSFITKKFK